jgi:iron complex outermembrane receptor protein
MSPFRHVSLFLLGAAILARAQSTTPPPAAPAEINRLDKFVVSAGPDPKTSFDLAQGTSVLAGDELRRLAQTTLGETLASTPGVSSTYFGPGASRPVIRGLGGDRVRMLDNGVGALDASNVSPDHNTALEPLFASRIEVLRGPSTLLYGSSAVGGAVNVIDNIIPDTAPDGKNTGSLELRGGGAANERAAVLSTGGGTDGLGFHLNGLRQKTDDTKIPGVARIDADAPPVQPRGTLPSSATDTSSLAGGATKFWDAGHLGASISHYETIYGVPTGDTPPTSIDMKQTRFDLAGEITKPFAAFRSAKGRLSFGDYKHSELSGGTSVNTTFKNRAWEGRLELPHVAIGNLTGTLGVQGARSDFSAVGDEVVTPPSLTQSGALFAVEEYKAHDKLTIEFGGRIEGQAIKLGAVEAALPRLAGYAAHSDEKKTFGGESASAGLVFRPAKDWSVGATLAYTERLPTAQELFSNGPHGGTRAYEVGTSGLGNERSVGFDLNVRRRAGFVTGSAGVFVNRFTDYIFEQELPATAVPAANNPDGLTPFQFVARDAEFRGAEAELVFHLYEQDVRKVHLEIMSDYVRAEQTRDHVPLPRIPPLRYGARLTYEDGKWTTNLEARHAERQDRFSADESATPGYTLVNASVGYLVPTDRVSYEFFVRGQNLGNVTAREHTSFLKEFAPLPGRGVSGGVRLTF